MILDEKGLKKFLVLGLRSLRDVFGGAWFPGRAILGLIIVGSFLRGAWNLEESA
jgi:hypothetical protein